MWATSQLIRQYGTKVVATATVKGVKSGKRLIPTRAALTLVRKDKRNCEKIVILNWIF